MLIDVHAHLNFAAFDKDRKEVIKRCLENNIWVINVGTNFETSKKAVQITENSKVGMFASVGLHPINLDTGLVKINIRVKLKNGETKELIYDNIPVSKDSRAVIDIPSKFVDYSFQMKDGMEYQRISRHRSHREMLDVQHIGTYIHFHTLPMNGVQNYGRS